MPNGRSTGSGGRRAGSADGASHGLDGIVEIDAAGNAGLAHDDFSSRRCAGEFLSPGRLYRDLRYGLGLWCGFDYLDRGPKQRNSLSSRARLSTTL